MRILKIKFHQVDKIKSLKKQLVEFKTEVEKLTSAKLVVEPNLKEKDFYIPPFKRNNEELKANIARIDKGKQSDVNAEVSKPMSKTPPRNNENSKFVPTCHHCHIVGHIRPNFPKLRSLSTSKVRSPSRKHSSSKLLMFVTIGASGHTHPNCFKLFPHKRVSNRSHPLSKGSVPILSELLKVLTFLTQFQENSNSSMSYSSHSRTRAFSSSQPKTRAMWVIKDPKT